MTSISPTSVPAGSSAVALTVNGSGFTSSSVIQVSGTSETTVFVSSSKLTTTVPASQLTSGGQLSVKVSNGSSSSSGGSVSLEVDNPAPTISMITPNSAYVGASAQVVAVTGTGFVPSTTINVNGSARPTTYASATQVSVTLSTADVAAAGYLQLTAVNSAPGGGTSAAATLTVMIAGAPVLYDLNPATLYTGSADATLSIDGGNMSAASSVLWNGTPLVVQGYYSYNYGYGTLYATVPAADLASAGTATITVVNGTAPALTSNALTVTISNPPAPTLSSVYPAEAALGADTKITASGSGFTSSSTILLNGNALTTTFDDATRLEATIPAEELPLPGNAQISVKTPAPGGGTSSSLGFTVYLPIAINDMVYNSADGLLYVSVPNASGSANGNSIAAIDPTTGNIVKQTWVGSKPNKLALSTDGTQLFVGLDGASSIAQMDVTSNTVVRQFTLGGAGLYNQAYTAAYLAAVPGLPNSVAVASSGYTGQSAVTIYDAGVARTNTSGVSVANGPMAFGANASTLYVAGNGIQAVTVSSTGITAATTLNSSVYSQSTLQYDNGKLYLSSGVVMDATTGALKGTFYYNSSQFTGPVVSDSTLGKAFAAIDSYSTSAVIQAFDEATFNPTGSIPVNQASGSYSYGFDSLVRWGQNGVAASDGNAIYLFSSPVVKDLSSTKADLSVQLTAPTTASTGTAIQYTATVRNLGTSAASDVALVIGVDSTMIVKSVTPSQGSCGTGSGIRCDLGALANGASATVTVSAVPSTAGAVTATAQVTASSTDTDMTNNQATASTTVSGAFYADVPMLTSISPNMVAAGSDDFTLTVNGTGFNSASTVNLGSTALTTSYVSPTQLTATVSADQVTNFGWAAITVTNAAPGGGVSQVLPLTLYTLMNVPANSILFDPFAQKLYATLPSASGTASSLTGNSVVAIDPATASAGTPVYVGSEPKAMSETSDGNYLYIALTGANSVARYDLSAQSLSTTIPVNLTQGSTSTSVSPTYVATMPGSDTTLALGTNATWAQFGIFDIAGSTGTFRTNLSGIYAGSNPLFVDAAHIYTYGQTYGGGLYRYTVDANGLTEVDGTSLQGMGGFNGALELAGGRVYGIGGGVADPSTTPPTQLALLSMPDFYAAGISPSGVAVKTDTSTQKEFLVMQNLAGTSMFALGRFDTNTFLLDDYVKLPTSTFNISNGAILQRWGQDGLAILSVPPSYSSTPIANAVLLMRGPFVTPQLLETHTAASLSSTSALTHGSGNTVLTLTGSNLLPGVAITWNGSYRTTNRVSATQVTVDIPASDLVSAGSAAVKATNPGAAASSALTVTIN